MLLCSCCLPACMMSFTWAEVVFCCYCILSVKLKSLLITLLGDVYCQLQHLMSFELTLCEQCCVPCCQVCPLPVNTWLLRSVHHVIGHRQPLPLSPVCWDLLCLVHFYWFAMTRKLHEILCIQYAGWNLFHFHNNSIWNFFYRNSSR